MNTYLATGQLKMKSEIKNVPVEFIMGDITHEKVDAIVNAANSTLLGGGGVDGAIHAAGGPLILEQCRELGGCATGEAKPTTAGSLSAKHIIHTVGPVYQGGQFNESQLLADCYSNSLQIAHQLECHSIAFPAISCGAYGYPVEEAAKIALQSVNNTLQKCPNIEQIRFILFSVEIFEVFANSAKLLKTMN